MRNLSQNDFVNILTAIYNGNRGAAEETVERIPQTNTVYSTDKYRRIKRGGINRDLSCVREHIISNKTMI